MPKLSICLFQCWLNNSLCLEMCLDWYRNHFSNAARSFGCLPCYQTRVLLFDMPTLSAFCECSSQEVLSVELILILRNKACFFLFLYLSFIICFMTNITISLCLNSIIMLLTILADKINVFFFHVFSPNKIWYFEKWLVDFQIRSIML